MHNRAHPGRLRTWALLGLATAMLISASPVATATANNMGTVKVHDAAVVTPPTRNEPHVECEFWLEGFNMADTSGSLTVQSWTPTGDGSVVLTDNWTGTPELDGKGSHFLNGPYTLVAGHYRVEVFSSTGHPGDNEHFAKAKMFWVDLCVVTPPPPPPPPTSTSSPPPPTSTTSAPPPTGTTSPPTSPPPEVVPLACPSDLVVTANGDGSITLTFTPPAGSDGTNIYRANGTADLEYMTTVGAGVSTYTDTTAVAGNAYTYVVTNLQGDLESTGCAAVEVSGIPEFPTTVAMGLATVGGLVGLVMARRKLQ